jgi:hypothetical protein
LFGTRCWIKGDLSRSGRRVRPLIAKKERDNTLSKKSDAQITQDVLDEIFWDPAVMVADLDVNTHDHRVTLTRTIRELTDAQGARLSPCLLSRLQPDWRGEL